MVGEGSGLGVDIRDLSWDRGKWLVLVVAAMVLRILCSESFTRNSESGAVLPGLAGLAQWGQVA